MEKTGLIFAGWILLGVATQALSTGKVVTCPTVTAKHYGKSAYYDAKTGRMWALNWLNKSAPVWNNVSIPQATTCGTGKSENGLTITYQCAIFQCKSKAVVASLGQSQSLKCFSTYISTQNTFYCDSFTTS